MFPDPKTDTTEPRAGYFQEGGEVYPQSLFSSSTPPSISSSIDPSLRLLKAADRTSPEFQQAMGIALGFGPGVLKDVRLSPAMPEHSSLAMAMFGESGQAYSIISESKGKVGFATISRTGTTARIELIRSMLPSEMEGTKKGYAAGMGPQSLGPTAIRNLARQYFEENPEIQTLRGFRISGAREKAGSTDFTEIYRDMVLKEKSGQGFNWGGMVGFQGGGTVIPFPSPIPTSSSQINRLIEMEKEKANPDWSVIREHQQTIINLEAFRKPGFNLGGIAEFQSGGTVNQDVSIANAYIKQQEHKLLRKFFPFGISGTLALAGGALAGIVGGSAFLGSALGGKSQGDRSDSSLPRFQRGGLAPIKPGAFESIPVTTESRGFVTPHLVQVYPQPKLGPLLAI
jgi:hypothetical protein